MSVYRIADPFAETRTEFEADSELEGARLIALQRYGTGIVSSHYEMRELRRVVVYEARVPQGAGSRCIGRFEVEVVR